MKMKMIINLVWKPSGNKNDTEYWLMCGKAVCGTIAVFSLEEWEDQYGKRTKNASEWQAGGEVLQTSCVRDESYGFEHHGNLSEVLQSVEKESVDFFEKCFGKKKVKVVINNDAVWKATG